MALPRRLSLLLLGALVAAPALASEPAADAVRKAYAATPRLSFPELDLDRLAAEDTITDGISGLPQRFAVGHDIDIHPSRDGRWSQDADGRWTWRLAVDARGAVHLNFGFRDFALPKGATMLILGAEADDVLGPYTAADRLPHGELWTPVLEGAKALIEVTLPAGAKPELGFTLQRVSQGYRGFGHRSKACKSGSCNTDVACLASDDAWNQPRRAVGAYTVRGSAACTGVLLNNTANDGRMLFATATHCEVADDSDAASVIVYWRYESETCRAPGSAASGTPLPRPSTRTTAGMRVLAATRDPFSGPGAAGERSDWTLLELQEPPAFNDFQLYWAGWDRSPPPSACAAPASASGTSGLCASIHHPSVHEKRITFVEQAMPLGNIDGAAGVHFRAQWDPTPPLLAGFPSSLSSVPIAVTERGSSGSPLFNADRRVIGVLSGGASMCGLPATQQYDLYGGLFHAWEGLGTPSTRMRDWLDPLGSAPLRIDGRDSLSAPLEVTLASPAFGTAPAAGDTVTLTASASGGDGNYRYEWDIDGDGRVDRRSTTPTLSLEYPAGGSFDVSVRAIDGAGSDGSARRTLAVRGAAITLAAGAPVQECGNGDAQLDPGEIWRLPLQARNEGNAPFGASHALVSVAGAPPPLEFGGNTFGYAGTANCGYGFIDIASGPDAVPALPLDDDDDGRNVTPITLGGQGVLLYGQRHTQAVMSTNGYVSFDTAESGGQYRNDCSGAFQMGARGPQLRPYHDDLAVLPQGGLRYRYFASCPRAAEAGGVQGCHVFQWSRMETYADGGDFEFQAIAYEQSGQVVYQYRSLDPAQGASATVGLIDAGGADPFSLSCNRSGRLQPESALCTCAPGATPADRRVARLPQAAVALPALAAGASATAELRVKIDSDAACGAPLRLDFIGAADAARASTSGDTLYEGTIAANCRAYAQCATPLSVPPPAIHAAARRGLYFNPQRPGNGLNAYFYDFTGDGEGSFFGGLWYTALADRTPAWYMVSGDTRGLNGEVPIIHVSNGAAPGGFDPVKVPVGRAWVAQVDPQSLLLGWEFSDGRRGIERMAATPGVGFAAQNHTQAWSSPAESGWGLAIESLDIGNSGFEFFAGYVFDAAGLPRWVVGDKATTGSGVVPLLQHTVHCPGCAFFPDYANGSQPAGSLQIQYTTRTNATLSTDITLPVPGGGDWTRRDVTIVPILDPVP